jgi:hypothetical protein
MFMLESSPGKRLDSKLDDALGKVISARDKEDCVFFKKNRAFWHRFFRVYVGKAGSTVHGLRQKSLTTKKNQKMDSCILLLSV